jgi:thymidylate kinase
MLEIVRKLFERLNSEGIDYCHWKSNVLLADALLARTDLDLLVSRRHIGRFEAILASLGFKLAVGPDWDTHPSIYHYYGFDEGTGNIVHLHAYYRLVTGGGLVKNYRLPLETMVLESARVQDGVRIPSKGAELLLFVIRKILEHTSPVEYLLLRRKYRDMKRELEWLWDSDAERSAIELVREWLPSVDPNLFRDCLQALRSDTSVLRRFLLGRRMQASLKAYAICSAARVFVSANYRFVRKVWQRFISRQCPYRLSSGGIIVAFVGPEASGKSTLVAEVNQWLREYLAVRVIHAGKPPASWITAFPKLLLPVLRKAFPRHRTTYFETRALAGSSSNEVCAVKPSLLYMLRAVWLAFDRNRLLVRAYKEATRGTIVLSDRYPSSQKGAVDSSQLVPCAFGDARFSLRILLARLEERLYRGIPQPDVVFQLSAPVEVLVERNVTRLKEGGESEEFVRRRYIQTASLSFGKAQVYRVDTTRPLSETVLEIKRIIWDLL